MQKEIHEQPRALTDTIEALIDNNSFRQHYLAIMLVKFLTKSIVC